MVRAKRSWGKIGRGGTNREWEERNYNNWWETFSKGKASTGTHESCLGKKGLRNQERRGFGAKRNQESKGLLVYRRGNQEGREGKVMHIEAQAGHMPNEEEGRSKN